MSHVPPPIPVLPIDYQSYRVVNRTPGLLTALAVMSFVVACAGLLANFLVAVAVVPTWRAVLQPDVFIGVDADLPPESAESPSRLSTTQIDAIIARVESISKQSLLPPQVDTLKRVLRSPAQEFVSPAYDTQGAAAQVHWALMNPQGRVIISFGDRQLIIGPGGQEYVVSQAASSSSTILPPGTIAVLVVLSAATALSVLLDLILPVLAILLLRGYHRAGRHLRTWALVKLPVEVAAGMAIVLLLTAVGAGTTLVLILPAMLILCAIWCAFPLATIITLRSWRARKYFESLRPALPVAVPIASADLR